MKNYRSPRWTLALPAGFLASSAIAPGIAQQIGPEIYRPVSFCDSQEFFELHVCPPIPMTQGQRCNDHAGLSVDAGGDWNGDGISDVIIGGGGKIDLMGQGGGADSLYGAVRIIMRGIENTVTIDDICPNLPAGPTIGPREELLRTIRIEGEQVEGFPHMPDASQTVEGGQMYADRFGWTVRFVGDVLDEPGSTMDEIAVSAPFFDQEFSGPPTPSFDVGAVYLFQFDAPSPLFDVDGDYELRLHPEGSGPGTCTSPAEDGFDYDYTLRIEGAEMGALFGYSICDEVDFDGDGIHDLVVGAPAYPARQILTPGHPWSPDNVTGKVYFIPGVSVRALVQAVPPVTRVVVDDIPNVRVVSGLVRDRFGASLASLGPVDTHAGDEVLVGAPQFRSDWGVGTDDEKTTLITLDDFDSGPGYVEIWRGGGPNPLMVSHIDPDPDAGNPLDAIKQRFGYSLAAISSSEGGGRTGFVVGAPLHDHLIPSSNTVIMDAGAVYRYPISATTPPLDWRRDGDYGGDRFGWSLASGGDWNDDGIAEVLVGAPRRNAPSRTGSDCDCFQDSEPRGEDVGALYILSDQCSPALPNAGPGLQAIYYGEQRRDRLGFSATFTGESTPSGDYIMAGALAYPATVNSGGLTLSEVGRVYRLDRTQAP